MLERTPTKLIFQEPFGPHKMVTGRSSSLAPWRYDPTPRSVIARNAKFRICSPVKWSANAPAGRFPSQGAGAVANE